MCSSDLFPKLKYRQDTVFIPFIRPLLKLDALPSGSLYPCSSNLRKQLFSSAFGLGAGVNIPLWFYLSQDSNSGVMLGYLQGKPVERWINPLLLLRLFHFMVNHPTRLGLPRKQDGVGMNV